MSCVRLNETESNSFTSTQFVNFWSICFGGVMGRGHEPLSRHYTQNRLNILSEKLCHPPKMNMQQFQKHKRFVENFCCPKIFLKSLDLATQEAFLLFLNDQHRSKHFRVVCTQKTCKKSKMAGRRPLLVSLNIFDKYWT